MGQERGKEPEIHLLGAYELIQEHLTEQVCDKLFWEIRDQERQRKWTLQTLLAFWVAVLFDPPRALRHALARVTGSKAEALLPSVEANPTSFFERCQNLKPGFFEVLFGHFSAALTPQSPTSYCPQMASLQKRFADILIMDGSRLDQIAHRLKITWKERSVLLPGCLLAVYDLFRGMVRGFQFYGDAALSEAVRVTEALKRGMAGFVLEPGTLLLGDRLYCNLQIFAELAKNRAWGLFRRNRTIKFRKLNKLRSRRHEGGRLTEWLVQAGSGQTAPVQKLRYIRYQKGKKVWELLTNVLESEMLSGAEALELYQKRWRVERMFLHLKEVLNLKRLYAANPNTIAMQVYAAAIVYNALRVSQARAAQQAKISPEELSPAKLFPLMAAAALNWAAQEVVFIGVQEANPRLRKHIRKPDWKHDPKTYVPLSAVMLEKRNGKRKRRRYCASRRKWKSFAHLPGGAKLT